MNGDGVVWPQLKVNLGGTEASWNYCVAGKFDGDNVWRKWMYKDYDEKFNEWID